MSKILNKNGGVTLAILIVAIVVMSIIFGITITSGSDLLTNSAESRLKTNLYLIKARAETLLEDYLFDGTDNLGEEAESGQIAEVGFEEGENYIYRVWNSSKLEEEGIATDNVASSEVFIIQYDVVNDLVDVASTKGYKDSDGNYIYILSEFE